MRILFVIDRLIYGGAETQLIATSCELARRGHSVVIHALRSDNPRAPELEGTGVRMIPHHKRGKLDPGLILRMRRFIRSFEPDVVHGFLPDGNLHARLAAAGTGVPVLNSERSDSYRLPLQHRLALILTRRLATGVVANSHAGARFAQRLFRLPDGHIHVVWNGIDVARLDSRRHGRGIDPAAEFFGQSGLSVACVVGMIRPPKDLVLALRVAASLTRKDPSWRLLFVGDCLPHTRDYKREVLCASDELGLDGVVRFAGVRPDATEIMRGSDVVLSTSRFEGFPNVVLEAMAVETPVVSTDYSDIRLILPNSWQVVGSREPDELADAVIRASGCREAVCRQQRSWLNAHGSLSHAVDSLEQLYRHYANGRTDSLTH